MKNTELPVPPFFEPGSVEQVWRVPYEARAKQAMEWARIHHLQHASEDQLKVNLVAVDVQNTFCIPGFELYVGGRSGTGAVDDNIRLCSFIYRNLNQITAITPTMDTHHTMQIFHAIYLVDEAGQHPEPYTLVSPADIQEGRWRFNPGMAYSLGIDAKYGQELVEHYAAELHASGKYALTIWPYHAMLGGIGHALVSAVEEAIFFHSIARQCQPDYQIKGENPLTEHYSAVRPEVMSGPDGEIIGKKNERLIQKLLDSDMVIITGQAKSHCVAWTIADLMEEIQAIDPSLAAKIYLLEDCTSPVVIPGVVDYTDQANEAYRAFSEAGMHVVRSTDPIQTWPGQG